MTLRAIVAGNPLIDALLKMSGLPDTGEVERLLGEMSPVEVVLDCSGGRIEDCKFVKLLFKGYDRVRLVEGSVPKPSLDHDVPSPSISVGGRLGGRFRFHGVPEELLAPPFMLAVAAAGGKWPPKLEGCPENCSDGSLALYVVPGVPCMKAIALTVKLLLCCPNITADIINIDMLAAEGAKLPVDRVPTFRARGRFRVGLPRRLEELVGMLKG